MIRFLPAFLRKALQDLRASYWFLPSSLVLLALVESVLSQWLDMRGTAWLPDLITVEDREFAKTILTTVASASIGAAGVMFSMTMVAVSFASSNFGPRLIGNFMQDRGVQVSLGILLATFAFSLSCLVALGRGEQAPSLSVAIALFFALISVGVMIYFVHHIPEIISLENLTANLGRRLLRAIQGLAAAEPMPADHLSAECNHVPVTLERVGYIQAVDIGRLRRLGGSNGWALRLLKQPGDFIRPDTPVIELEHPAAPSDLAALRACFAMGNGKTEAQNPMFLAQQLTEIIARALSPGVNDPITAINCLNWLHSALCALAALDHSDLPHGDEPHMSAPISFIGILRLTHADMRQYIGADALVSRHALSLLTDLHHRLPQGPRRVAVAQEYLRLLDVAPDTPEIAAFPQTL